MVPQSIENSKKLIRIENLMKKIIKNMISSDRKITKNNDIIENNENNILKVKTHKDLNLDIHHVNHTDSYGKNKEAELEIKVKEILRYKQVFLGAVLLFYLNSYLFSRTMIMKRSKNMLVPRITMLVLKVN